MNKLFKLVTLSALVGIGATNVASADPLAMIGSAVTQNNIGTNASTQNIANIIGSTVANGTAGNTFTVAEVVSPNGYALFTSDNFLQQNIGSNFANQTANTVVNSSVANNAAGNAITFSGQ